MQLFFYGENMIRNMKDLKKVVDKYIEKAMIMTRDEIFEVLSEKVSNYYDEPVFYNNPPNEPRWYERTGRLMEELTGSNIKKVGNSYYFTVGWSDEYLSFTYPGNSFQRHNPPINPATGHDVLTWMNSALHGGTVNGSHNYFDEAIEELNARHGSIPLLFKKNLRKCGLPIK